MSMSKPQPKNPDLQPPRPEVPPGHGGPIRNPNCNDVLSGRGGRINSHSGNVHFRELVESLKRDYLDPRTKKLEKARIAARLVGTIRRLDPSGKFLKEDPHTGMWVEIGDERAWKKAGQALRESAPEIRAEQQAQLQAAVVAASMGSPGQAAMGSPGTGRKSGASSNCSGGRQADPPGPRHRPNPPEREGLARSRAAYDQQQLQTNEQDFLGACQEDDDLELNQLRREYYQMKRMQQEQQARMQQYQQNQGSFFSENSQSQTSYHQQSYLDDGLQSVNSGGFSVPSSQGSQHEQMQLLQQMQQLRQMQQQYINMQNHPTNRNHQQQRSTSAFEQQFNTCDKTVSSMSSFDVHSMDMSSLGGYSSFAGNQSQNLSFAGNQSQGMSMNSIGSVAAMSRGGRSSKSALERKLEKVNELHRQQVAAQQQQHHHHPQQQQQQQHQHPQQEAQTFIVPTHTEAKTSRNVQEQNMQSIGSFGFEAIEEDNITEASCKLSNLGFSEMDMTFNSDVLSIRSKSAPSGRAKESPPENATKQSGIKKAPVTASSIFDQRLDANSLQSSVNKSGVSMKKGGFSNSNITMDDFNESFKSMDVEDNRVGPVDPDGDVPGSSEMKKVASSASRRTGRQREPAGGRLPSIHSGARSSCVAATNTGTTATTSRRESAKRNSIESSGLGLSNDTLGLSDPLMGDFGVSMNSLRSLQSQESNASSWLNQYQSMDKIATEKNPWDDECGSANSSMSEISAPRMVTTS